VGVTVVSGQALHSCGFMKGCSSLVHKKVNKLILQLFSNLL
jgi:hypothetical protein